MADTESLCNAYKQTYGKLPNPIQLVAFSKQRGSPINYMTASQQIMQSDFSAEFSEPSSTPKLRTSSSSSSTYKHYNGSYHLPSKKSKSFKKHNSSHSRPKSKHTASKSVSNIYLNPYHIPIAQSYQITKKKLKPVPNRKISRDRAPSTTFGVSFSPKRSYQFMTPKYINSTKGYNIVPKSKSIHTNITTDKDEKQQDNDEKGDNQDMAKWVIMGNLLHSIQHSWICRQNEMNQQKDFKCIKNKQKQNKPHLDSRHYESTTFLFKEYATSLFVELRAKWLECDILADKYVKKLFGKHSANNVKDLDVKKACNDYWRRLDTNSKSGQIFFQTSNGEYIIKSMPKSEADYFRKNVLQHYHEYMMTESDSLLTRIMGFYKIRHHASAKLQSNNEYNSKRTQDANKGIYVIVMKSILFCNMTPTAKIHQIYDLKGSKHNRTASRYKLQLDKKTFDALKQADAISYEQEIDYIANKDVRQFAMKYAQGFYEPQDMEKKEKFKEDKISACKGNISVFKRSKVMKDMDFIQDDERINVGERLRTMYLKQLRNDLDFLTKMNVMDYSLLVGIHTINTANNNRSQTKPKRSGHKCNLFNFEFGGMCNENVMVNNKKNIYFTGIIDFLQQYNAKKRLESYYKRVKYEGKDVISSVDAKTYANRLYSFIEKRIV